jgi:hypothetical protein
VTADERLLHGLLTARGLKHWLLLPQPRPRRRDVQNFSDSLQTPEKEVMERSVSIR